MATCPYCGFSPVPSMLRKCPHCQRSLPDPNEPEAEGTRLESVEAIRRWVEQGGAAGPAIPASAPAEPGTAEEGAAPFHPFQRPPLALLCILDDGSHDGQWIRLRQPETVIGRTEGDVLIPHDEALSGRHCVVYRTATQGFWQWRIKDLNSSNGTFARVATALLKPQQEILLGACRFRFEVGSDAEPAAPPGRNVTRAWQEPSAGGLARGFPALVELLPQGDGARYPLSQQELWLGSSPEQCQITWKSDPFLSKRHAQVSCDRQGRWQIRDAKSRNGTWLRIRDVAVRSFAEFQAGEQRFCLRIPSREN